MVRVVSGHDFSRAESDHQIPGALAPAGIVVLFDRIATGVLSYTVRSAALPSHNVGRLSLAQHEVLGNGQ